MARFIETFARVLGDPELPRLFFVDGGALAVENALKVAFDWKSRHNERRGIDPALGARVLHLRGAFHGRSGYTLSLTNTKPVTVARFPKFDWPRIDAPFIQPGLDERAMHQLEAESLRQARAAFEAYPHDIACFIAEPIQGEGGDRHFRPEFFTAMRELCDEHDALLIFDEVQTGCGSTGTPWAYQQLGVAARCRGVRQEDAGVRRDGRSPGRRDRRQRLCGHVTDQLDVGRQSGRHGAGAPHPRGDRGRRTVRATRPGRATICAPRLDELAEDFPALVLDPRGRGLMCAFSHADQLPTATS